MEYILDDKFNKDYDDKITIECDNKKINKEGETITITIDPSSPKIINVSIKGATWPKKRDGSSDIVVNDYSSSVTIGPDGYCDVQGKNPWLITPKTDKENDTNQFSLKISIIAMPPSANGPATVTIGDPLPSINDKKRKVKIAS